MTTADHIPARTGPPRRPFAAVSIQVANIVRWPRSLADVPRSKESNRDPFDRDPRILGQRSILMLSVSRRQGDADERPRRCRPTRTLIRVRQHRWLGYR